MLNEYRRRIADIVGNSDYVASLCDPGRAIVDIDNYAYVIDNTPNSGNFANANITDGAPGVFDVQFDAASTFYMLGWACMARTSTAPVSTRLNFAPALNLQIKDQSTGRNYFDRPILAPLIAGAGGFPFLLPSPRVVRARTALTVTASVAATAAGNVPIFDRFFFVMHGARVYYGGPG